jgi:hypothetical protein
MNAKRWVVIGIVVAALSPVRHHAVAQAPVNSPPERLHETGLFARDSADEIAPDILSFTPQYPLWSDGAKKRRWISIPQGTFIDASRPDAWEFPRGTRFWKEFSVGRRVETRLIERLQDGSWRYATYIWNEAGTDAVLAPADGAAVRIGQRRYTIPSTYDCRACHEGGGAPVLGFSALQLSADRDPLAPHAEPAAVDLRALATRGWLRNLPQRLIDKPPRIAAATPTERAALGYLHANCGHCHSKPDEAGAAVPVSLRLAQSVVEPDSSKAVLQSLLSTSSRFRPAGAQGATAVVMPGASHSSVLALRMRSRDPRVQMPPLGTDIHDSEALALIERWIDILNPGKEPKP